ncbi:hypothetical protein Tco_0900703, partial [Tanacetum coccineum]
SPKKSRGKGSQRKKTTDESQETVDVSEESEPEPESLDKSISQTEAKEAEAARQVHATHARIVTESVLKPTRRRKSGKVTSDPPKKLKGVPSLTPEEQEAADIMQALKKSKKTSKRQPGTRVSSKGTGTKPGVPNESTVVSATSSEGTSTKPGVPDEEKEITEENLILEWGSKQETGYSEEDKLDDEEKDDKEGDVDDKNDETESDEDDIYKYKIHVHKDEDEEMINGEVDDSDKGNEEVTDAAKADAEKTLEVKDDPKKTELPPTSSSLFDTTYVEINSLLEVKIQSEVPHTQSTSMLSLQVSVIFELSVVTPVRESLLIATVTTLPPPSVSTTPSVPQQTTTPIPTPTITTDAPIITTAVSESDALSVVQLRVAKLEKDVSQLKKIDLSLKLLRLLKIKDHLFRYYLGCKVGDKQTPAVDLEQESKKSPSEILKIKTEQAEKQKMLKFTIKSTDQVALKEYDQKSALYQTMHANKSFNRNLANHRLYHDLMEALIDDENSKQTKRKRTKDSESSKKPSTTKETPKGNALSKGSKTGKSAFAKEPVEEPIDEVVIDNAGDDDQPQDASKPKTTKYSNRLVQATSKALLLIRNGTRSGCHRGHLTVAADYFFNNDLEYLKSSDPKRMLYFVRFQRRPKLLGEGRKLWHRSQLNKFSKHNVYSTKKILGVKSVSVKKLHGYGAILERDHGERVIVMFYKFTVEVLCSSRNVQGYYALGVEKLLEELNNHSTSTDLPQKIDFKGTIPLISTENTTRVEEGESVESVGSRAATAGTGESTLGHPGHLTFAADYFFNNDLEYLKSSDLERTYTTSIMKTKSARYEIEWIEDMKILGVKSVSVKKLHGYGHLEEIVVIRADHQFYKFKEGDLVDLHLNDIEDMLLLAIQHKLFHLTDSDIKKLNITPPQQTFLEIEFKELYTPSHKPPGVIYEDLVQQKRVMRADELYKFSDRTLKKLRDELHHRVLNFDLGYNKEMERRIDKKSSALMVELIDKQMRERRII